MNTKNMITIAVILILAASMYFFFSYRTEYEPDGINGQEYLTATPTTPDYQVKKFDLDDKIKGLSNSQINQHKQLYAGYVNKRNEITQKLKTVNRQDAASRTYSPYRALKVAETYAVNGQLLHELYFENLGKPGSTIGSEMAQLIIDSFGSIEAYKQDLMDSAGCARGWAITAWQMDDHRLHNYVLEEHNTHVPVLAIPLLVLDVYEHAYMIDFGINCNPYLKIFWDNIDWDVVEGRINKWVKPLKK